MNKPIEQNGPEKITTITLEVTFWNLRSLQESKKVTPK